MPLLIVFFLNLEILNQNVYFKYFAESFIEQIEKACSYLHIFTELDRNVGFRCL